MVPCSIGGDNPALGSMIGAEWKSKERRFDDLRVRAVFKTLSLSMCAEFDRSAQIPHSTGRGSTREQIVRTFLADYLPSKYAVGQGQIIHGSNRISRQMDVVVYDHGSSPRLLVNEHSIFPLESVYGTVSVKSVLDSNELKDAFDNIASVNRLVENKTHMVGRMGLSVEIVTPKPVGVVFAFDATRSLEAVAAQAKELQAALLIQHTRQT